MVWPARGGGDHGGQAGVVWRRQVGSASPGHVICKQFGDEVVEPVLIGSAVGVRKGHDFALGGSDAGVSGYGQAEGWLAETAHARIGLGYDRGGVGGAVVYEDDFVIRVGQAAAGFEAALEGSFTVSAGDDDGDFGEAG